MSEIVWSQDVFSKGELSPYLYARVSLEAYQKGLFEAQNVLTYPQGAAGKRFGTIYNAPVSGVTSYENIFFESFEYSNECTYVIVIIAGHVYIYLEGFLIADVTSGVVYTAPDIAKLDSTILGVNFRTASPIYQPKDLVRSANSPIAINGFTASTLTVAAGLTADLVLPVTFTTGTSLPTSTPQLQTNVIYFIRTLSTTAFEVYSTAPEAKAQENAYVIASAGTAANVVIQNTWTFGNVSFRNRPVYDFTGGYDTITFTPGATTGYGVTITMSAIMTAPASMTSAYIGGAFVGNGGIARIVSVADTTHFGVNIVQAFDNTNAIPGTLCLLTEPAWSDVRGWPSKCSSFQNRSVFANSRTLPNGLWLSVINDYDDFDDIEQLDDNAISWYPTSDTVNYIRFIVPYRSLTIHTNSGIFSTPLTFETAITPNNFSMTLQDSTPATSIQPRGIDNQIIVISGNDVHSMLWDGFNNSYTSSIASVANEQLIRNPHDEVTYTDLARAGSRYIFIINEDGSMAMFQTLISDSVQGFSPARLTQSYGEAYFRWGCSSSDGRAWFLTEREIASSGSPNPLVGFTELNLAATGSLFSTTTPSPVTFTTTGSLPTSSPQLETSTYYWVIGVDANAFRVYLTQADAENAVNPIEYSALGSNSNVVPWPLSTVFYIEELSFDIHVDCATVYSGSATSTITSSVQTPNIARFNAQDIKMQGDGYGFEDEVVGNTITFDAHGESVEIEEAQAGFPIELIISPMPLAPPGAVGYKGSSLAFAQHIKIATLMFIDTIGGYVTVGDSITPQPITTVPMSEVIPGDPPSEMNGAMQISLMRGWNQVYAPPFSIEHDEPFPIKLIGIFYKAEI